MFITVKRNFIAMSIYVSSMFFHELPMMYIPCQMPEDSGPGQD
jgi:hypothetical protein